MKKMYKKTVFGMSILFVGAFIFAQNIELPDVTTVIEGDSIKAGLDTLPDFNDVLVVDGNSGKVVPKLPEVETPEETTTAQINEVTAEKTIFAEGLIGGGYPTLFQGNFSVFRMSGESPFKLEFDYNSANGYANEALTDGFYDRNTKLLVEKSYKKDKFTWGVNGFYQAANDGLQSKVAGISSLNHETYDANGNIAFELGKGFTLGSAFDVNFYNRYADVTSGSFPTVTFLNLNPELFVSWEGYGAKITFDADYLFGNDTKDQLNNNNLHRGDFNLAAQWANSIVNVYGDISAVVGNNIGDNSVIVPFTIGADAAFPVSFSNRKFTVGVAGGIATKSMPLFEAENKYKFTAATVVLPEQSDWYGKLGLSLPGGEGFTCNFDFEYRQTAFGNNIGKPDYDTVAAYGCYDYIFDLNRQANTNLSLAYHYKFITFTGTWNAHWGDVPVLENKNEVTVEVNFQDESAKWGADLFMGFGLDESKPVPVINMEGFARITPAVRAVISVNDIVELMKAEQRVYAGQYIGRSGNVSALLKFFF